MIKIGALPTQTPVAVQGVFSPLPANSYGLPPVHEIWGGQVSFLSPLRRAPVELVELPAYGQELSIRYFQGAERALPLTPWTGSKRPLLTSLLQFLPERIDGAFIVPFAGMLALTLELLHRQRFAQGCEVILADVNAPLMTLFWVIRDSKGAEALMNILRGERFQNDPDHYYPIRESFNGKQLYEHAVYSRLVSKKPTDLADAAAEFYFLMRFGHGGMHRVRREGEQMHFNIPFGWRGYEKKKKVREVATFVPEKFHASHHALSGMRLCIGSFDKLFDRHLEGKLRSSAEGPTTFWCDPPYVATELDYMNDFPPESHWTLAWYLRHLHAAHAPGDFRLLLTNSDTPQARRLYDYPLFRISGLEVARPLASISQRRNDEKGRKRGEQMRTREIVVTTQLSSATRDNRGAL